MGCASSKPKSGVTLSKSDIEYLMKATNFTKKQIKDWYSGFLKDCPSGQLSKVKFIENYQQLFPQGKAQKFCEHIFRTFDTDNSGKIDFKEFIIGISITAKGDPQTKLKWAFKMYDVDGNGEIDKNEMHQIIQSMYDLVGLSEEEIRKRDATPKQQSLDVPDSDTNKANDDELIEDAWVRTEQIFEKMDSDKNGVISEQEFVKGCTEDKFIFQLLTADYSETFN